MLKPDLTKLLVAFHSFANFSTSSQLRICREVIAVCSEIHKKHRNIIRENNVEFFSVEPGGAQSNQ
jgi:gluconate kinase